MIRDTHYDETVDNLKSDPIIIEMVEDVQAVLRRGGTLDDFYWDDGTPRHEFMMACNNQYRDRGGEGAKHLGAVGEAIWELITGERSS